MTKSEIDDLHRQLLEKSGGAHIHTANKAVFYLERFSRREDPRIEPLTKLIHAALTIGDWTSLKCFMGGWW